MRKQYSAEEKIRIVPDGLRGKDNGMNYVRGAPYHPRTQGKIERWHQTLKSRISLENHFLPGDLEKQIEAFVEHYNHQRYHESLKNLTPDAVCTINGTPRNMTMRNKTLL